ncbi:acyl-CoA carboxylase epsilon subunit [Demequina sp. NBRC 110056]|uniref:acyl-CoA carboxylase epsilon subunit n=1 Tax=Demequina sp. NBRC 110056 TaxID=1570345 RepID=UPI000A00D937|nr:acyl-CoA carboxylase epsilon subunit [Demequina sp. NBRC 110056]
MSTEDALAAATGLRIVRGAPDEAELAALVAGVVAVASSGQDDDPPGAPTSAWMDRSRTLRGRHDALPLARGASAWRHSLG